MAIKNISVDWGIDPRIVRITDDTTLAAITTAGYGLTQAANIQALQNGKFQWLPSDYVLIYYSNGEGFFTYDPVAGTFTAAPTAPGSLSNTLPSGDIFVGNGANVATGVALSGDATMANTGAITIANLAVTAAKIANNTITSTQIAKNLTQYVRVALTAAQFNGMYAAPVVLVAAAGANTLIVVKQAVLEMTFVSAAYANGGAVSLEYDTVAHAAGVLASSTMAAATVNGYVASTSNMLAPALASGPFTTTVNKGLYISNDTAPFITGDSTWFVHVWYSIAATV